LVGSSMRRPCSMTMRPVALTRPGMPIAARSRPMPTNDASGALILRGGSTGASGLVGAVVDGAGDAEEDEAADEAEGGNGGSLKMISWTRFRMR